MWCGALERDRLAWLFLSRKTDFFNGKQKSMLHIAPEHCFSSKFSDSIGDGYLTADIDGTRSMVQMDITNIQYPDNSFDVIYCSHVLEHVPDDRTAIRECFRILKLGGWAILLVPVSGDKTFQDLSITDPAERVRLFGQDDHVRQYGADFVDLLKEAGFMVKETVASDFLSKEEVLRMGLGNRGAGAIFYCTKQL
jgi:SAM-dependent methyltransferase